MSSVCDEEQENQVAIFVSSCSVGIAGILLCAVSHTSTNSLSLFFHPGSLLCLFHSCFFCFLFFLLLLPPFKAIPTGANAAKVSSDDASGLEALVCLAKSARVMLTSNFWVKVGLANGAMCTLLFVTQSLFLWCSIPVRSTYSECKCASCMIVTHKSFRLHTCTITKSKSL